LLQITPKRRFITKKFEDTRTCVHEMRETERTEKERVKATRFLNGMGREIEPISVVAR